MIYEIYGSFYLYKCIFLIFLFYSVSIQLIVLLKLAAILFFCIFEGLGIFFWQGEFGFWILRVFLPLAMPLTNIFIPFCYHTMDFTLKIGGHIVFCIFEGQKVIFRRGKSNFWNLQVFLPLEMCFTQFYYKMPAKLFFSDFCPSLLSIFQGFDMFLRLLSTELMLHLFYFRRV